MHTEVPPGAMVTPLQSLAVRDCVKKVKETCQGISSEHKDVHGVISKFGRAIDKVCWQAHVVLHCPHDTCIQQTYGQLGCFPEGEVVTVI